MSEGKGYNGRLMQDITAAGGCPKGNITALKDGVVTRAVLFDATRLPGKATSQGWLEPGTAIHRDDLEALEKMEHVKVSAGDVILLYTGRWKRRAALGPCCLFHKGTRRFIHRRRRTERRPTLWPSTGDPNPAASTGAGGDGGEHFR
jgi:hypothetical protein